MPINSQAEVANKDTSRVYDMDGGRESDRILHQDIKKLLSNYVESNDLKNGFGSVLDIGVGRGAFTKRLVPFSKNLLVTDYMPKFAERVKQLVIEKDQELRASRRLAAETAQVEYQEELPKTFSSQVLDVSGNLSEQLGANRGFDLITCLSVLMKLKPAESKEAIQQMYELLNPGGVLLIATISYQTASRVYTPASWLEKEYGPHIYSPRAKGVSREEMDEAKFNELFSHPLDFAEYYPFDSDYIEFAKSTGGEFKPFFLPADKRCLSVGTKKDVVKIPSIYSGLVKEGIPLWSCVKITKKVNH